MTDSSAASLTIYIILLREKHPAGMSWFCSGETFTTREAAERDIETGRSAFFEYRLVELSVAVPLES